MTWSSCTGRSTERIVKCKQLSTLWRLALKLNLCGTDHIHTSQKIKFLPPKALRFSRMRQAEQSGVLVVKQRVLLTRRRPLQYIGYGDYGVLPAIHFPLDRVLSPSSQLYNQRATMRQQRKHGPSAQPACAERTACIAKQHSFQSCCCLERHNGSAISTIRQRDDGHDCERDSGQFARLTELLSAAHGEVFFSMESQPGASASTKGCGIGRSLTRGRPHGAASDTHEEGLLYRQLQVCLDRPLTM